MSAENFGSSFKEVDLAELDELAELFATSERAPSPPRERAESYAVMEARMEREAKEIYYALPERHLSTTEQLAAAAAEVGLRPEDRDHPSAYVISGGKTFTAEEQADYPPYSVYSEADWVTFIAWFTRQTFDSRDECIRKTVEVMAKVARLLPGADGIGICVKMVDEPFRMANSIRFLSNYCQYWEGTDDKRKARKMTLKDICHTPEATRIMSKSFTHRPYHVDDAILPDTGNALNTFPGFVGRASRAPEDVYDGSNIPASIWTLFNHTREVLADEGLFEAGKVLTAEDWKKLPRTRYILSWMAYPAIHLSKTRTILCFQGLPGAGKDSILEFFYTYVYGMHLTAPYPESNGMFSKGFNGDMAGKMRVHVCEAHNGDRRQTSELLQKIKSLATDSTAHIRRMRTDAYTETNYISISMCSNYDDAFVLDNSDRRYSIFKVNCKYANVLGESAEIKAEKKAYYDHLRSWFTQEVGDIMMSIIRSKWFLDNVYVDPTTAYETQIKLDSIAASASPMEKFMSGLFSSTSDNGVDSIDVPFTYISKENVKGTSMPFITSANMYDLYIKNYKAMNAGRTDRAMGSPAFVSKFKTEFLAKGHGIYHRQSGNGRKYGFAINEDRWPGVTVLCTAGNSGPSTLQAVGSSNEYVYKTLDEHFRNLK